MSGQFSIIPCYDSPSSQTPTQQQGRDFAIVAGAQVDTRMSPINIGLDSGAMPPQSGGHVHRASIKSAAREDLGFALSHPNELTFEEPRERRFSVPTGPKDMADAMGTISANGNDEGDGDGNQSFFGSSSTFSFMKHIKRTVEKRSSSLSPQELDFRTPAPSGILGMEHFGWQKKSRDDDGFLEDLEYFILPRRSVADHLIDCYWTWVHSLYPFLHRPSFMRTYNQLWTAQGSSASNHDSGIESKPPCRMFRSILNLIFAFGCQFSSSIPASRRDSSSDVFFKRSRLLMHVDILGPGSILLVQALLLMGQYLQSTKYPNRCWNVAGLAIRVAQGLGMHLDSTSQNQNSVVEREVWRRTWHGCILLDRFVQSISVIAEFPIASKPFLTD
jgi:hypothetical protein